MENIGKMSRVQKLTFSAMVMALYIVILYFTQSFSFGAYQIRIATSLYALSYLFPFLVLPLGLANFISNMLFGGFGIVDMLGGCILAIPYPLMALNLCIGQIVPAIVGVALVKALERVWRPAGTARVSDSRRADS